MAIRCVNYGASKFVFPKVKTGVAIAKGDMVYIDTGDSNLAKPAGSYTWDTDLATTQTSFHLVFIGIADQDFVGETFTTTPQQYGLSTGRIRVIADENAIFECDSMASATVLVGSMVGPAKQTGNLLEPQKVAATATELLSVGRVTKDFGASATRVQFQISPARAQLSS